MQQRHNIQFCFKLGNTATETYEMLIKVYGKDAVSRKCVYDWFKHFRNCKESVEDDPGSVSEIQAHGVTASLKAVPKQDVSKSFQKLYECCQKWVVFDGEYFQGQ